MLRQCAEMLLLYWGGFTLLCPPGPLTSTREDQVKKTSWVSMTTGILETIIFVFTKMNETFVVIATQVVAENVDASC